MVSKKWQEFPLRKEKAKEFDGCRLILDPKLYRVDRDGTTHIKLRWELLVLFGTAAQLRSYDRFRLDFVENLLSKHCAPLLDCKTQVIGSRSPKSNIDINMMCPNPNHMETVLNGILIEFNKAFPNASMEDVFDLNIYGSVFRYLDTRCNIAEASTCYPRYEMGYRQRMWSFLRIVEFCETLGPTEKSTLLSSWPSAYQRLYTNTKSLYRQYGTERNREKMYIKAISKYLNELKKNKPDPHDIAETFSKSKVLEHDTYRSVGAVLHIVENQTNLKTSGMYDSTYDNLGFIFQVILKGSLCGKVTIVVKYVKIAKYITRVYDAVQIINRGRVSSSFKQLNVHSVKINTMRKALAPMKEIAPHVTAMLATMNLDMQSAQTIPLLANLSNMVFRELRKDELVSENTQHHGKRTKP
jgi:hypothetical protein